MSIAYTIINATGLYSLDCKNWRHKPATDRTWANFKILFAKVFKDAQDEGLTAQTSVYAANFCQLQEDEVTLLEMQQETATALANIVTATTSYRMTFITLTATNADLARQITTITAHLVTAQGNITTLTTQLVAKGGGGGDGNKNSNSRTGTFPSLEPMG